MAEGKGVKSLSVSELMEDLANVSKWHSLGTHLGLEPSQLDVIEQEIPAGVGAIQRRKGSVLDTWMKGQTGDPLWREVVSALMKMGEKSIAEEMRRKYSGNKSTASEMVARENQQQIKGEFVKLQMLVSKKLQTMKINKKKFLYFIKGLFQCADFIPPSKKFDDIFEAITRYGLWDFINYSPLRQIAKAFAKNDEDINTAIYKYQCALAGYLAGTKLADYIASMSPISEEVLEDEIPCARNDKRYFNKLSIKLEAKVTEESLDYLIELWDNVSVYLGLPSLTYLLDEKIREGCVSVVFLIPPSAMPAIALNIDDPETAKFFSKLGIIRMEVDDLCLYEEQEQSVETATEQKMEQNSSLKQFPDSQKQVEEEAIQGIAKATTEKEQDSSSVELPQHDKEGGGWRKLLEALQKTVSIERKIRKRTEEENGELRAAKEVEIGQLREKITGLECMLNQTQEELREQKEESVKSREQMETEHMKRGLSVSQEQLQKRTEEENGELRTAIAYKEVEIGQLREKITGLECMLNQTQEELREQKEESIKSREQMETEHMKRELSVSQEQLQKRTEEENVELRAAIAYKEVEIEQLREKITGLECMLNQTQEELKEQKEESVKLRVQMEMEYMKRGQEQPHKPAPQNCKALGRGLQYGETNQIAEFQVHLTGANGEPCVERQEVRAELKSLVDGHITQAKVSHQTRSVGSYSVSYQPSIRGRHELSILVNIQGSPFRVYVQQPPQLMGQSVRVIRGLNRPRRATLSSSGQLIVTEHDSGRISVFDGQGELVRRIDSLGPWYSRVELNPTGVAIDDSGTMYVCDWKAHKLFKVSSTGKVLNSVGGKGSGPRQFDYPDGIALRDNRLYICDRMNHRIQIFSCDLNFISSVGGSRGSGEGEFHCPRDIALDQEGNMYVVEDGNHRVQVFSPSGTFLRTFGGKHGRGSGELSGLEGIHVDHSIVYITEWDNHCISTFTTSGEFITSFGSYGSEKEEFRPFGITMDCDGFLYVCDSANNCVQVF